MVLYVNLEQTPAGERQLPTKLHCAFAKLWLAQLLPLALAFAAEMPLFFLHHHLIQHAQLLLNLTAVPLTFTATKID